MLMDVVSQNISGSFTAEDPKLIWNDIFSHPRNTVELVHSQDGVSFSGCRDAFKKGCK